MFHVQSVHYLPFRDIIGGVKSPPGPHFINVRRNLHLPVNYATKIYGLQMMLFQKDTNGFVYNLYVTFSPPICLVIYWRTCVSICYRRQYLPVPHPTRLRKCFGGISHQSCYLLMYHKSKTNRSRTADQCVRNN